MPIGFKWAAIFYNEDLIATINSKNKDDKNLENEGHVSAHTSSLSSPSGNIMCHITAGFALEIAFVKECKFMI